MSEDGMGFPERDDRLGRLLAETAPLRERSDAEWAALEAAILAAAELPLARPRWDWGVPVQRWGRSALVAAAVAVLVLGGVVQRTARPASTFAEVSAELIDLLGEEEVRSYFPGADDPDRLLEAAIAAR
jgi:hypothetical protein